MAAAESSQHPTSLTSQPTAGPGVEVDAPNMHGTWLRTGIALVLTGQSMVFGLAVNLDTPEGWAYPIVHSLLFLAAAIAIVLLAPPLLRETWNGLKARKVTVEMLFTLSAGGALVASLIASITGTGAVYYEVVALVLAIYTVGKALGARSREKALRAAGSTAQSFTKARKIEGTTEKDVAVESLAAGDLVRIRSGEAATMDGFVEKGEGQVTETMITGETFPVWKKPGDRIWAGSHSLDGNFVVCVDGPAGQREVDRVLETIRKATLKPSALQEQADRLMQYFLPIVVVVHVATLVGWTWYAGWTIGLFNAMAVLLVACPCALGLATPIAVWGTLVGLARKGLVSRTGDFLDNLAKANRIVFDKTGTLSEERLRVLDFSLREDLSPENRSWLESAIPDLASRSLHPVAQAIAKDLPHGPGVSWTTVQELPGQGLVGHLNEPLKKQRTLSLLQNRDDDASRDLRKVHLLFNDQRVGEITLEERFRQGQEEVLEELKHLGVEVSVLTGDASSKFPKSLAGIDFHRGLKPQDKVHLIEQWKARGEIVLFVGDGANDAPALAVSDGGIAMGHSADLTQSTASAVLPGNRLATIPESIVMTRIIRQGVRRNLQFATLYNLFGMGLAAGGVLHPVVAALLMVVSSIVVSGRALALINKASFRGAVPPAPTGRA
ncbi:MAG: cation-translocating P-type ATPase [Opitutales bacterium]|nr:cation-translocating P-type ATPase [Opitutales bacterium]